MEKKDGLPLGEEKSKILNNALSLINTLETKQERDLSELYQSIDDPKILEDRKSYELAINAFADKWGSDVRYTQDPEVLSQALEAYEKIGDMYDEYHYISLLATKYTQDKTISARYNQTMEFVVKMMNKLEFFLINIGHIPQEKQAEFLNHPGLTEYKHFLEKIFINAKYVLSEKEEQIINTMTKTSLSNRSDMLESFLSKDTVEALTQSGEKKIQSFEELMGVLDDQNEEIRKSAYDGINTILLKYRDVAEKEINSILEYKKNIDEMRGLARPDTSRHLSDDIESSTVDTLVKSIADRYTISQKYYAFKAKLLGKEQLEYYEKSMPYGETKYEIKYEQAVDLVRKAFEGLDKKFVDIFDEFLAKGRIDVYPQVGKQGGAYCSYQNKSGPVYVFLNHTNTISDTTTLAHEMGHAINFVMLKEQENSINYASPTSIAEVASTFMEGFALQEILKSTSSDEDKLTLMLQNINNEVSTIQRQIAFYQFEQALHSAFREKGYLSADEIGEIFHHHLKAYMGEGIHFDELSKNRWIYISHFRTFFYVYSYAGGLLMSKAMQSKYKEDPSFIEKIKTYLRTGQSQSPKQIFAQMGIDMEDPLFWKAGLDEQESFLDETIALAKKLGKI